nr:MAG TPA: hypothetical protein [Caudoviricetes sp.]
MAGVFMFQNNLLTDIETMWKGRNSFAQTI